MPPWRVVHRLDLRPVDPAFVGQLGPIVGCPNSGNLQTVPCLGAINSFICFTWTASDSETFFRLVHPDNCGASAHRIRSLRTDGLRSFLDSGLRIFRIGLFRCLVRLLVLAQGEISC